MFPKHAHKFTVSVFIQQFWSTNLSDQMACWNHFFFVACVYAHFICLCSQMEHNSWFNGHDICSFIGHKSLC